MSIMFTEEEERAFRDSRGNGGLPDGSYETILTQVEAKLVGKDRLKKLVLSYEILLPQSLEEQRYIQFLPMDNINAYGLLKSTLKKFGLRVDGIGLSEIESEMKKLVGAEVHFTLITNTGKNGKEYQNAEITAVIPSEF